MCVWFFFYCILTYILFTYLISTVSICCVQSYKDENRSEAVCSNLGLVQYTSACHWSNLMVF